MRQGSRQVVNFLDNSGAGSAGRSGSPALLPDPSFLELHDMCRHSGDLFEDMGHIDDAGFRMRACGVDALKDSTSVGGIQSLTGFIQDLDTVISDMDIVHFRQDRTIVLFCRLSSNPLAIKRGGFRLFILHKGSGRLSAQDPVQSSFCRDPVIPDQKRVRDAPGDFIAPRRHHHDPHLATHDTAQDVLHSGPVFVVETGKAKERDRLDSIFPSCLHG